MNIELDAFKNTISNTFYDKEVEIYPATVEKDEQLFTRLQIDGDADTFMGNVFFDNLEEIQETYGIKEKIAVAISTQSNIANGSILKYGGKWYKLIKSIPRDTHYLLAGKEWLSRFSVSISA